MANVPTLEIPTMKRLTRIRSSTSDQLQLVASRIESAPEKRGAQTARSSVRRNTNSLSLAEMRRRRKEQQNRRTSLPKQIIQTQIKNEQNLSPRQIQCVGNYDLGRTIGKGKFGKVKVARHVLTGETVAIKIIRKSKLKGNANELVRKEIDILKTLNHPNIVRLYEVKETERVVFLILELANGGEALDYIVTHGKLPEDLARRLFRQIINALSYCHKLNIIHRDLKAENLLLDEELNIKVIDFGLATIAKPDELLTLPCGSPKYAAPELIMKLPYNGPKVDIWSLGVVLYVFVCGHLPFKDSDLKILYKKITCGDYCLPDYLSNECKDLISSILCIHVDKRFSMFDIINHPWVIHTDNWECNDLSYNIDKKLDDNILAQMELFGFNKDVVIQSVSNNCYNSASATVDLLKKKYITNPKMTRLKRSVSPRRQFASQPTSRKSSPLSSPKISPKNSTPISPRSSISPLTSSKQKFLSRVQSQKLQSRVITPSATSFLASKKEDTKNSKGTAVVRSKTDTPSISFGEKIEDLNKVEEIKERPILRKVTSEQFTPQNTLISKNKPLLRQTLEKDKLTGKLLRHQPSISSLREQVQKMNITAETNDYSIENLRRHMSTKRILEDECVDEPRVRRSVFSGTTTKEPKDILNQIEVFLKENNILYEYVEAFTLKGLITESKVKFEIELCSVANLKDIYAIRLQRIDGKWDSYREFCEKLIDNVDL